MRKCRDVAVRAVRQLIKVYGGNNLEGKYTVVRLLLEESFHRVLLGMEGDVMRKRGLCAMMVTFKGIEENTMGDLMGSMGLFSTMDRANVSMIVMAVEAGGSTLRQMPSFEAAMAMSGLKHEVFSLLPVRMAPTTIRMTKNEVRHVIQELCHRPLEEDEDVPGAEGPSMFEQFFQAEAEETEGPVRMPGEGNIEG